MITQPRIKSVDGQAVFVKLYNASAYDRTYFVHVELLEWTDKTLLIQEIELDNGMTVVECFTTNSGVSTIDSHWTTIPWPRSWRRMKIYPGIVDGADFNSNGFAMLESNLDGSVKTTVGSNFNETYRKNHEVRGRVVNADLDKTVEWYIEYNRGRLSIYLPDGSEHHYYDKVHYVR